MRRTRPRSWPTTELLVISCAFPTRGFLRLPVTRPARFHVTSTNLSPSSIAAVMTSRRRHGRCCNNRYRLFAQSAQRRVRRRPRPNAGGDAGTAGRSFAHACFGNTGKNDPNDPLPRTMDELYRQIERNPAPKPDEDLGSLRPQDLDIVEDVARDLLGPLQDEHDRWWATNGEELELTVSSLKLFADGKREKSVWDLDRVFSGEDDEVVFDDELLPRPFSLTAYKRGGAAMLATNGSFELTPFAEYWDVLPDLRVTKRVYAHNAVDRMAALKYMMNCTDNGMFGKAGSRQPGHFLWGYVDQLDWMRRSGRLSPTTPGSLRIDRDSWWSHVSFALTIAPLAAAIGSEIWPNGVSILDAKELQRPEMKRAVRAWRRVWRYSNVEISQRLLVDMPVHDALREDLRRVQWAAHLESLDAVEALYLGSLDALPQAEREFARGWCRAARLFALSAAHTNLDKLIFPLGAGYPPERILGAGEKECDSSDALESVPYGPQHLVAEAKADLVAQRNTRRCVQSVRWLGVLPGPAFTALRLLWRRACVSYPARRGAARILRQACYGAAGAKAGALGRSIMYMFVPNINYRKLTPPFGIDPAEEVEYDSDLIKRDPTKILPRPPGSYPLNPLQRPWYEGPRPQQRLGVVPEEDDDDGLGGAYGGMFPPGTEVPNMGIEATERQEKEQEKKLRRANERIRDMIDRGRGGDSDRSRRGEHGKGGGNGRLSADVGRMGGADADGETPVDIVFT